MRQTTKIMTQWSLKKNTRQPMIPRENKNIFYVMRASTKRNRYIEREKMTHEEANYLTFSGIAEL